eukprot:421770_1
MDISTDQSVDEWLLSSGLSLKSINKLIEGGYNTMALFMVCTQEDIDEIGKEFNLLKSEKLKLKCAVNKLLENKTDKLQIIDPEEGNAIIVMEEKIKLFLHSINNISTRNNEIDQQHKICEKLLNDIFNKIELKLHERKKELSQKLSRIVHIKHKILSTQTESINKNLTQANNIKKQCHKLLEENKETDIKCEKRKQFILNKENEIKKLEITNNGIPKVSSYLFFDFKNNYKYLLHTISNFGNIINQHNNNNNDNNKIDTSNICDTKDDEWDNKIIGCNIIITTNRNVICNETQQYCYRSCFGNNIYDGGTHHWKLQIKQYHHGYCAWNMLIGVMKINNNNKDDKLHHRNSHFTANNHGYGFIGNLSYLTTSHGNDRIYGNKFINVGDIIDIYLNLNKYTLSYKINNIEYGIAYENLQQTRYCLAVTFCGNKNQLQMLKYNNETYN